MNTANALTVLYDCLKDDSLSSGEKAYALQRMDGILQLGLFEKKEIEESLRVKIQSLVDERTKAKKEKDYAKADGLRDELKAMGVTLMDSKEGTTWELN